MVRKHLPMILSPFLDMHHDDLLQPKGELGQIVPFDKTRDCNCRKTVKGRGNVEEVI